MMLNLLLGLFPAFGMIVFALCFPSPVMITVLYSSPSQRKLKERRKKQQEENVKQKEAEKQRNKYDVLFYFRCEDRSMIRFLCIDPMASGSNPPSAKLYRRVRRVANSLYFQV